VEHACDVVGRRFLIKISADAGNKVHCTERKIAGLPVPLALRKERSKKNVDKMIKFEEKNQTKMRAKMKENLNKKIVGEQKKSLRERKC
jgi:hypothetical protein